MMDRNEESPPFAQEKQAALLLLRRELNNEDNFVQLLWGATTIKWPNPERFRDALGTHTDVTYKALLRDMEDGEDSQQVRGLCSFFLQSLEEEDTADKMEKLEGEAIEATDLSPLLKQVTLTSGAELQEEVPSRKELLHILCEEIDLVLSRVQLARREKGETLKKIAAQRLRCLQDQSYWKDKVWSTTRQDLQYISELKTRLCIGGLENLPHGSSQEVTLMLSALRAARSRLQLLVSEGETPSPRGSEAKSSVSTGTSEAGKAKIEALKRAVGAAEAFLLTEESQGQDFALLKKLEILERTLGTTVEKMENSQGRLQMAPAEADKIDSWISRGHKCSAEIT